MTQSNETSLESRAETAVRSALGIKAPDVPLRMGSTPGWDSMGHMTIVMALEREFKVRFPAYKLPELVDVPSITKAVSELGTK